MKCFTCEEEKELKELPFKIEEFGEGTLLCEECYLSIFMKKCEGCAKEFILKDYEFDEFDTCEECRKEYYDPTILY